MCTQGYKSEEFPQVEHAQKNYDIVLSVLQFLKKENAETSTQAVSWAFFTCFLFVYRSLISFEIMLHLFPLVTCILNALHNKLLGVFETCVCSSASAFSTMKQCILRWTSHDNIQGHGVIWNAVLQYRCESRSLSMTIISNRFVANTGSTCRVSYDGQTCTVIARTVPRSTFTSLMQQRITLEYDGSTGAADL